MFWSISFLATQTKINKLLTGFHPRNWIGEKTERQNFRGKNPDEKNVRDGFVASINNWYSWTDYANYDIWVCGASPCWIVIDQTTQITGVFRQASVDLGYGIVLASLYMSSYSISIIYCIIAASFKWPFALVIQNVLNSVYILIHPRNAIHPAIA